MSNNNFLLKECKPTDIVSMAYKQDDFIVVINPNGKPITLYFKSPKDFWKEYFPVIVEQFLPNYHGMWTCENPDCRYFNYSFTSYELMTIFDYPPFICECNYTLKRVS